MCKLQMNNSREHTGEITKCNMDLENSEVRKTKYFTIKQIIDLEKSFKKNYSY